MARPLPSKLGLLTAPAHGSAARALPVVHDFNFSAGDHSWIGTEQCLLVGDADSRSRRTRDETARVLRSLLLVDIGV